MRVFLAIGMILICTSGFCSWSLDNGDLIESLNKGEYQDVLDYYYDQKSNLLTQKTDYQDLISDIDDCVADIQEIIDEIEALE